MTLEIFSRSLKKGQVEAVVMGEWSKGPFLGAMTMFPDSETEMMQPEEAPKALGIFSRSLEEGNVEGNVGSSSKGPPKRPPRKDSVHDEQRPRLKRSSSEDHATQKFRKRDSTKGIVPFHSPVHENGGFLYRGRTVGNNLGTYQGRAKIYRGCGAQDSRLLPWKLWTPAFKLSLEYQ